MIPPKTAKQPVMLWLVVIASLLKIPPRSRDLNPIENIFNIVSRKLEKDALDGGITSESYAEFCDRVQRTIYGISQELIDKTIVYEWPYY